MPAKKHNISAANFRDPLLKVLGQLTGFKTGIQISHEKTYLPVFQMMGVSREQYGMDGTSNVYLTERWVQWCVNQLIGENLVLRTGKGQWELTSKGVETALALIASDTAAAGSPIMKPDSETTVVVPVTPSTLGQSVMLGPNNSENLYHPDPYIRSLAVADSPCLGGYTERSPVCVSCLVKGNCLNAMAAIMSNIAAKLSAEDLEEEAKRKQAEENAKRAAELAKNPKPIQPVAPVAPTPAPAPVQKPGAIILNSDAKVSFCAAAMEAPCQACGKDIPIGTPSAWVRKLGPDKKASAMLHKECYDKISGGK